MARRRLQRKVDNDRPVVVDDFIYNDPDQSAAEDREAAVASDTPEEAVRKLRRRSGPAGADKPAAEGEKPEKEEKAGSDDAQADSEASSSENKPETSNKVYSSGIMLDENLQPVYDESARRPRKRHPVLRVVVLVIPAELHRLHFHFKPEGSHILLRGAGKRRGRDQERQQ